MVDVFFPSLGAASAETRLWIASLPPFFMLIEAIVVGALQVNCYLVVDTNTQEAVLIDPGDEAEHILHRLSGLGCRIKAILLTHAHFDHVMGVRKVKEALNAPILLHEAEVGIYEALQEHASAYGFHPDAPLPADRHIKTGDVISFGTLTLSVRETPGHSPGGVSYVSEGASPVVFSGDALFAGSIGRTDFPNSSFETLERSIRVRLYTLPDDTVVYPGHGPATTIGREKQYNPYVRA